MRAVFTTALAAGALAACRSDLPAIDPTSFACFDDRLDSTGILPCPETHFCEGEQCAPRFGCRLPNAGRPGCDAECSPAGAGCFRCEPRLNGETAATVCESGIHTATSARPRTLDGCECPDGTHCVAFAGAASDDAYPLFLLPPGTSLRTSTPLGVSAENPDLRMCVRACSTEFDCPANHTCRATAVVQEGLLANPTSARHTIGTCYPDRLAATSTVAFGSAPDLSVCLSHEDCPRPPREPCRFQVIDVPDHPTVPARDAWGSRRAIVARCGAEELPGLKSRDEGCIEGTECRSGICRLGRCASPCDPSRADCPANRSCSDFIVMRALPGGAVVEDHAYVCADR